MRLELGHNQTQPKIHLVESPQVLFQAPMQPQKNPRKALAQEKAHIQEAGWWRASGDDAEGEPLQGAEEENHPSQSPRQSLSHS